MKKHDIVITRYNIIADCTDNVATRYLLNDACVLLGKPLVSGSALRFEGQVSTWTTTYTLTHSFSLSLSHTHTLLCNLSTPQLTVYNYAGGPCYRCLYPTPPPPHTVTNCSDGGVLGAGTLTTIYPQTHIHHESLLYVVVSAWYDRDVASSGGHEDSS